MAVLKHWRRVPHEPAVTPALPERERAYETVLPLPAGAAASPTGDDAPASSAIAPPAKSAASRTCRRAERPESIVRKTNLPKLPHCFSPPHSSRFREICQYLPLLSQSSVQLFTETCLDPGRAALFFARGDLLCPSARGPGLRVCIAPRPGRRERRRRSRSSQRRGASGPAAHLDRQGVHRRALRRRPRPRNGRAALAHHPTR